MATPQIPNTNMNESRALVNQHFADQTQHNNAYAAKANLPLSGVQIGGLYIVLDDGDSKGAIYLCVALTGVITTQYTKIADVDWGSPAWGSISGKPAIILADGTVAMTGDLTLKGDPSSARHAATKNYVDSVSLINSLIF